MIETLHSFDNRNLIPSRRNFAGLSAPYPTDTVVLEPRSAALLTLHAGDLLSIAPSPSASDGGSFITLCAFDERGHDAAGAIGLVAEGVLDRSSFSSAEFDGWCLSRGGISQVRTAHVPTGGEMVVLAAKTDVSVCAIQPVAEFDHVCGLSADRITLSVQRAPRSVVRLPAPLGDIRDEFTVSRATAVAYRVAKGEVFQIIDVEGQQCSDFMAFRAADLDRGRERMIEVTATRSMVRGAYPGPGLFDKFYDQELRPLLKVEQDTVGRHDTFGLACTARGYEERGFPGHVNCSDNMSDALAPYGVERRSAWPAINFFWNTWVDNASHRILTEESFSRPGDYVAMRALDDLVCVSTACPDDIDPINGWNPTDVHVRIYRDAPRVRRAVAYREKEDAPAAMSTESAFHARTSALTQQFAPARDLWMPVSYPSSGTLGEYWACRSAATVQDMSALRKYDIIGPDAGRLLQYAMSRNVAKLPLWRGAYMIMCDDRGEVIDDGTLFHIGPHLYRWCCGSEESGRSLVAL
ncbi:MAG: DUF1989 domain-containing protein, partial [Pseudomonadota bacterium]